MKEVKAKIRKLSDVKKVEENDDKIILEDFLPEKVDFEYDADLKNLLYFIRLWGDFLRLECDYKKKDLSKEFIFLNPGAESYKSFVQMNSFRFLVYLSRKKIISDLYLPLYVREGTKLNGTTYLQCEYHPSIVDWGKDSVRDLLDWHFRDGSDVRKYVVHFLVKDWIGFLKIKKDLEDKERNRDKIPEDKQIQTKPQKGSEFNPDKSVLHINEYIVEIQKFSDQYHLLRIIFEDPKELLKEWFFSEIAEKYDEAKKFPAKKFYNAAYQLNRNIAAETGIKDFFITNTQSFKVDSKYI